MSKEEKMALLANGSVDETRSLLSESLLLRVNVEIEKIGEDGLLGNGDFIIKVDHIGIDLRTNILFISRR